MKVKVLFFAQLKEFFGESERTVEVEEGTTVSELASLLVDELKRSAVKMLPLRYAVNEKFEDGAKPLQHHDVLALIPPVSGG